MAPRLLTGAKVRVCGLHNICRNRIFSVLPETGFWSVGERLRRQSPYGLVRYPVKGGNEGEAANYEESAAL